MMRVRVVAFATATDLLGADEIEIEIADDATLGDLVQALHERFPALVEAWPRLAVAVNGRLARPGEAPAIEDGTEVALLPPVSGGAPPDTTKPIEPPRLVEDKIDVDAVCRAVAGHERGATVLFLGTVRDHHAGRAVARLDYSGYRPMATAALQRIVDELEAESDGLRVSIVHRLGSVPVGTPSVAIATASPHREAAYAANRTALERLKREVPIWKREYYADGEVVWREEEPLSSAHAP